MYNTMRKLLSAVLVCVLCLGLMVPAAVPVAADETELTAVSAWNLVLADEIAVNFHVSISDAAAEDAVMQVTDGYGTTEYPISKAEKNDDGTYLFTAYLAAAQMTDSITLQLVSGEETGPVHSYTAAQYANAVLSGDYSQSTKDLVLAMLGYGAAAQVYFEYNTENLANAGHDTSVTAELPEAEAMNVSGSVSGISYYGASLLYQSRIAVRFYFQASGLGESYTFTTANGNTYTPVAADNGLLYVDIPGINPQDYDETISLQVSDGTDTLTVSYSPMMYILRKYASSTNEALQDLVAAMYQYHAAATAYLTVVPVYDLNGFDVIGEATDISITNASAVEENFVFETLASVNGHTNVIHMYSDPANDGGYLKSSTDTYYLGANIAFPENAVYTADGIDFIEMKVKSSNMYCDNYYITALDADGVELGKAYKRMAMTADWSSYRLDISTLGLTEEELENISTLRVSFQWSKQDVDAASPVTGEVYVDDITFGSYVDKSTDMFDHIASIQNVEWWWSGNNTYGGVGWLTEVDADGSTSFKIYRGTVVDSGAGYTPRRQYLYFDSPVTLAADTLISIDATNTYMGTSSKISFLGDDGNKYGYLELNQAGTYHYEIKAAELALLNSDTHMTKSDTVIDVSSVKIIGVILHNDFFNGDKTYEGNLVMDNFVFALAPNPLEDMTANYKSLTGPTAVQENFVCEILEQTDDGHTNVLHLQAVTDNGQPTSNWPGETVVYIADIPSYADYSGYDYVEWKYKQTGITHAFYLSFYDADGNSLATTGGIYASKGCGWVTHRASLADIGLTVEEIPKIARYQISVSWDYNSTVGSLNQAGEFFVDDIRFGSVVDDSTDLFDHIVKDSVPAAAQLYTDSDMYFDENGAYTITRATTSSGWTSIRLYFDKAITAESDWILSCDFDITNFHHGGNISIIGSDGLIYGSVKPDKAGQNTVSKVVTEFTCEGTAFDPATVQIVGIHISYSLGTSTAVTDTTAGGYMKLDNLILTDPSGE